MSDSTLKLLFVLRTDSKARRDRFLPPYTFVRAEYVLMTQKTLADEGTVFFDPNTLAADGTKSLGPTGFSVSLRMFLCLVFSVDLRILFWS